MTSQAQHLAAHVCRCLHKQRLRQGVGTGLGPRHSHHADSGHSSLEAQLVLGTPVHAEEKLLSIPLAPTLSRLDAVHILHSLRCAR